MEIDISYLSFPDYSSKVNLVLSKWPFQTIIQIKVFTNKHYSTPMLLINAVNCTLFLYVFSSIK
jgi:hypothetical protein